MTALCDYLRIKTTGGDNDIDPFLQTLSEIRNLENGWTSDIREMPEVRITNIINYLLAAHDITVKTEGGDFEEYSESSLKSYKALRAYDLWESGNIHSLTYNPLEAVYDFCSLRCTANPSGDTSGTQYSVVVVFKTSGEPVGGSCSCVAGQGEACTHIAGLLFAAEDFVSRGYKSLSDQLATTEKLCKWIVPKGPSVTPAPIKKVPVHKRLAPKKTRKEKTFRACEYNPVAEHKRGVDYSDLVTLRHTLSLQHPNLPWVRAVAPAITEKYRPQTDRKPPSFKCVSALPGSTNEHPEIVPARVININTDKDPLTIKEKAMFSDGTDKENTPRQIVKQFVDKLEYSAEERDQLNRITIEQSKSPAWHKYRKGLITASNFNRVCSRVNVIRSGSRGSKTTDDNINENLVNDIINGSKFKGNVATRYGQSKEKRAAELYEETMATRHSDVCMSESGLRLHQQHCFLGASPDRLMTCSCHQQRLVEVKCPYRLADKDDFGSVDFVTRNKNTNQLELKETSAYYMQIQGQMSVVNVHECDLVIYCGFKDSVEIVPVKFNGPYWKVRCEKLCFFFQCYIAPRLLNVTVTDDITNCDDRVNSSDETLISIDRSKSILQESRKFIQSSMSNLTKRFPCGHCGHLLKEEVTCEEQNSVGCDCKDCDCNQWFHWKCVNYAANSLSELDEDTPWYCRTCVRNCDNEY